LCKIIVLKCKLPLLTFFSNIGIGIFAYEIKLEKIAILKKKNAWDLFLFNG